MSESEFELWQSFYQEQPFGLWRDDYRAAMQASTTINTVAKKPTNTSDFMHFYNKKSDQEVLLDSDDVVI